MGLPCLGLDFPGTPPDVAAQTPLQGPSWASPNTLIYVEVQQPRALLEQSISDHFQTYLYAIASYQRCVKSKDYRDMRAGVAMVPGLLNTTWG